MIKKVLAMLVGASVVVSALAGCSSKTADQKSSAGTNQTSTSQKATLKFVHCEGNDKPPFIALMKEFQEKNPNITVNASYMVNSELKKQMQIAMLSNSLPDITVFDNPDFQSFASGGYLADITDRMNKWGEVDQFQPGPLSSVKYKDKIYGIPWYSNNIALLYNQDMLDKVGVQPPKTWDELRAAAAKLTGNGVYGLAIAGVKSEVGTFQFIPWLYNAGGTYDKLDSQQAIKAMTFLRDMIKDGYMSKEVVNYAHGDLVKVFEGGKAAMVVQGSWMVWTLKNDVPNMKYGVTQIPTETAGQKSVTCLGGYNVGITKDCKNVDAAFEFLKFIGGKEGEGKYSIGISSIPTRKDAQLTDDYKNYPLNVFVNQMPNAVARVNPFWPDLSANVQVAMQEALLGTKTPEKALQDAQAKNADYWK